MMSSNRRSVYFTETEIDLLKFVEAQEGSFNFAIKSIIKQVAESHSDKTVEILKILRQLSDEIAGIKTEIHDLKQIPLQIAPLPLQKEVDAGNVVASEQADDRDYSGLDDL